MNRSRNWASSHYFLDLALFIFCGFREKLPINAISSHVRNLLPRVLFCFQSDLLKRYRSQSDSLIRAQWYEPYRASLRTIQRCIQNPGGCFISITLSLFKILTLCSSWIFLTLIFFLILHSDIITILYPVQLCYLHHPSPNSGPCFSS